MEARLIRDDSSRELRLGPRCTTIDIRQLSLSARWQPLPLPSAKFLTGVDIRGLRMPIRGSVFSHVPQLSNALKLLDESAVAGQ